MSWPGIRQGGTGMGSAPSASAQVWHAVTHKRSCRPHPVAMSGAAGRAATGGGGVLRLCGLLLPLLHGGCVWAERGPGCQRPAAVAAEERNSACCGFESAWDAGQPGWGSGHPMEHAAKRESAAVGEPKVWTGCGTGVQAMMRSARRWRPPRPRSLTTGQEGLWRRRSGCRR